MKSYREFQFAWWIILVFLFMTVMNISIYASGSGDRPVTLTGLLISIGILFVLILLFYGMTTTIDAEKITVAFGVGLIRKNISIEKIKSVQPSRSSWLNGWGIRFIRKGMLYNIYGLNCVELSFHNSDRIIKIGTQNAAHLKSEIEKFVH